jgi:hypothetical protein
MEDDSNLHSCVSSRYAHFNFQGAPTEMVADSVRDTIFDTEIVTALGRALGDENFNISRSAVEIFKAIIAQGALSSVCGVFKLKY